MSMLFTSAWFIDHTKEQGCPCSLLYCPLTLSLFILFAFFLIVGVIAGQLVA